MQNSFWFPDAQVVQSPVMPASVFKHASVVQSLFKELMVFAMQFCLVSDFINDSVSCSCRQGELVSSDAARPSEQGSANAIDIAAIRAEAFMFASVYFEKA
jgi:hypothetical protein